MNLEIYKAESDKLVAKARGLVVYTPQDYERNLELERETLAFEKRVKDFLAPHVERALEAHRALVADRDALIRPSEEARRISKSHRAAYEDAEAARRRQAELEAQDAARKAEEDRRLAEAVALEQNGDAAAAQATLAAPIEVPAIVLPREVPKAGKAQALRTIWKARIMNSDAVPREFCVPDQAALNSYARATKGQAKVPGVEFYSERI